MKKQWLFTTLPAIALCVICFVLFPTEAKAASVNDLTFTLNSDGQSYAVSDCDTSASGVVEIPAIYNGKPVTSIGNSAFEYCKNVTGVAIPGSVTSIGNEAFYWCVNLTSIAIPNGVTRIEHSTFENCLDLTEIAIPSSITYIGSDAFYDCDELKTVYYGGSASDKANISFTSYNGDIQSAKWLYNGYGCIAGHTYSGVCDAFCNYCADIRTAADHTYDHSCDTSCNMCGETRQIAHSYDNSYDTICNVCSEARHPWFLEYKVIDGAAQIVECDPDVKGNIIIPSTLGECPVTAIHDGAFRYCDKLTGIAIPNTVTRIGDYAFEYCEGLTNINIPNGVTGIGYSAFRGCYSLTSIVIPNSLTFIDRYAFYNCDNLTTVEIGNGVISIPKYSFADCASLTKVTIGISVTNIDSWAFDSCYKLTDVYFGGSQKQWNEMQIGSENEYLTGATLHCAVNCDNGHHWDGGEVTKKATCNEEGVKTYTCTGCGETKTASVAKLTSHSYDDGKVTKKATCNEEGVKTYTCTVCNAAKTETIAKATNHTPGAPATATADQVCTVCGKVLTKATGETEPTETVTVPATEPTTEPATVPTTELTTVPTTEPMTEPATAPITNPPTGEPTVPATVAPTEPIDTDEGDSSAVIWIIAAAVIVLGGVTVGLILRKKK